MSTLVLTFWDVPWQTTDSFIFGAVLLFHALVILHWKSNQPSRVEFDRTSLCLHDEIRIIYSIDQMTITSLLTPLSIVVCPIIFDGYQHSFTYTSFRQRAHRWLIHTYQVLFAAHFMLVFINYSLQRSMLFHFKLFGVIIGNSWSKTTTLNPSEWVSHRLSHI